MQYCISVEYLETLTIFVLIGYFIFGYIQLWTTHKAYFEKGRHSKFYKNVMRYGIAVIVYFSLGILSLTSTVSSILPWEFYPIYLFGCSFPIAIYNMHIMKKKYPSVIKN